MEWFTSKVMDQPLTAVPLRKSRFTPSKFEAKRIKRMVRAIKEGRIYKPPAGPKPYEFYDIWNDDADVAQENPMNIPAPKMKLPGTDESYNPPEEYLMDEDERKEWEDMDPEDRKKNYIPTKHNSLRAVPGYQHFLSERFERCLDLYLCPRVRKHRVSFKHLMLVKC